MAANKLPDDALLDDLCTRFVLNVPAEELASFEKLMFLVEQAHWFYLDFCRDQDPTLRSLGLKEFTALLFRRCPGLSPYAHLCSDILARFTAYKQGVPVMGAVLLDPSMKKCLLVREETGFDVASRLVPEDCIEMHIKEQRTKLFIIAHVDEATSFAPLVRGEIGGFAWHVISDLPATKQSSLLTFSTPDGARHKFYNVWPYVKQLKHWIKQNKRRKAAATQPQHGGKQSAAEQSTPAQHAHAQPLPDQPEEQAPRPHIDGQEPQPDAGASVPESDALQPRPAETAHVSSAGQPGQSWLHFTIDAHAVMRALDASLANPRPAAVVAH